MRPKLTYANVTATLALIIAVGGASAFAATQLPKNSVGTKQLKNRSVTGKKVAKNTLTGANINASTLGTVPNATHAASADTAANAEKLGGQLPSAFQARVTGACKAGESVASVNQEGGVNCTINGGPPSGPAGGALRGTYPNPLLAPDSVGTETFASNATAPNAAQFNGLASSAYMKNGDTAGGALSGTFPNPALASNSIDTANFKSSATAPNATKLNGIESSGFIQSGQAAGGALSGTYPNPSIATGAVTGADIADSTITPQNLNTQYSGYVSSTTEVPVREQYISPVSGVTSMRVIIGANGQGVGGAGVADIYTNSSSCTGTIAATFNLSGDGSLPWTYITSPIAVGPGWSMLVCVKANASASPVIVRNVDIQWG